MDYAIAKPIEPLHVLEPDILVKAKFYQTYRRVNPPEPEKALLFGVLSEAIETYQKFAFSRTVRGQVLFWDAEAWIWDEEPDYLVSFQSICQLMGLDPAYLRRGLLEWRAKNSQRTLKGKRTKSSLTKSERRKKRVARAAPSSVKRFRRPRLKGGWLT